MWNRISYYILHRRRIIMSVVLALTAFFGFEATRIEMSYQYAPLLPETDSAYVAYRQFVDLYGNEGNTMVVGVRDRRFFDRERFALWRRMASRLRQVEGVSSVFSASEACNLHKDTARHTFAGLCRHGGLAGRPRQHGRRLRRAALLRRQAAQCQELLLPDVHHPVRLDALQQPARGADCRHPLHCRRLFARVGVRGSLFGPALHPRHHGADGDGRAAQVPRSGGGRHRAHHLPVLPLGAHHIAVGAGGGRGRGVDTGPAGSAGLSYHHPDGHAASADYSHRHSEHPLHPQQILSGISPHRLQEKGHQAGGHRHWQRLAADQPDHGAGLRHVHLHVEPHTGRVRPGGVGEHHVRLRHQPAAHAHPLQPAAAAVRPPRAASRQPRHPQGYLHH